MSSSRRRSRTYADLEQCSFFFLRFARPVRDTILLRTDALSPPPVLLSKTSIFFFFFYYYFILLTSENFPPKVARFKSSSSRVRRLSDFAFPGFVTRVRRVSFRPFVVKSASDRHSSFPRSGSRPLF